MDPISTNHFLSLPRPDIFAGPPAGAPDTTTLAAHDFDVDNRTGFMPPQPPPARLPSQWEAWECILDEALQNRLQLGQKPGLSDADAIKSETWRSLVRELPILPIDDLKKSELSLRRAHHVLGFILHFYIHSLPPKAPIAIPRPVAVPLLQVSTQLQLPPVLTYSDNVLYNWDVKTPSSAPAPALDNLRCQDLFTGTNDEQEFYLASARIELRGVEALELMRATMDEVFVGDAIAVRRITAFLARMAVVVRDLRQLLLAVREGCDPRVFYSEIRPWFRGADSDPHKRAWVFEGLEEHPELQQPAELSGPSAGQSSIVHALDVFLGVDKYSHSSALTGSSGPGPAALRSPFLNRMQLYMPRHHRTFLNHLSANPRPLRGFVEAAGNDGLLEAYNTAVAALKEFRDAHMIIVALYIVGPARRAAAAAADADADAALDESSVQGQYAGEAAPLKGTGGTELVNFLKGVRDQTAGALLSRPSA